MSEATEDIEIEAEARVGHVLREKWRLVRLLGVGGMACVYAAEHRNGMRGAVKMLHPMLSTHADARARFLREGYAANAVGHDGVVRVLDDDIGEDGAVFLVMELLDGASVDSLAQRYGYRLSVAEAVAIGDGLLDVLAAAHDKEIWHRDLKPENLFLTRQGRVKVLDFGIAKIKQDAQSSRATTTGAMMGTPAFMPPEQALGRWSQVDGRSDLWAVGATLLYLLTGRLLHQGETVTEMLISATSRPAPPVRTLDPAIPDGLAAVLDRALAFDKSDRWPNARSMQTALRAACGAGDVSRLVDELGTPWRRSDPPAISLATSPLPPEREVRLPMAPTSVLEEESTLATDSPIELVVPPSRARSVAPWLTALTLLTLAAAAAGGWFALKNDVVMPTQSNTSEPVREDPPVVDPPATQKEVIPPPVPSTAPSASVRPPIRNRRPTLPRPPPPKPPPEEPAPHKPHVNKDW